MARIRTIKPEFFTSEDIVSLSPMARLLYIATWCEADKEGRLVWKPLTFKLRYFPADDCNIQALCDEIVTSGLVQLYGNGYAVVPTFKAHQHINPRESVSQLPEPDPSTTRGARVGTRQARDSDAQGGREGKGKEGDTRVASRDEPPGFAEFWQEYPNHSAKANAVKAWGKITAELHPAIMAAVIVQKRSAAWTKDNGQFVPHAATWLNGKRWEDQQPANSGTNLFAGAL